MSRTRKSAELLPILAAAFPRTFFIDPAQVQSLKIDIHLDLLAALPAEIKPIEAKRFLHWYVHRAGYLRALLHGRPRIDLAGAVVDREIPAEIRERARESWLQLRAARQNPKPTGTRPPAKPSQPRPAALAIAINPEELYSMAVDAKLEVILKFSVLPNARPAGQGKMAFALKTSDGQFVTVALPNKAWNKLTKAAEEWPSWVAALTGTMGERTEKGFTLAGPGLQVFEKKAKTVDTAPPVTDTASVPTAEPVPPPVTAAPVTVTTKAGTATVTVTKRVPLSLKR